MVQDSVLRMDFHLCVSPQRADACVAAWAAQECDDVLTELLRRAARVKRGAWVDVAWRPAASRIRVSCATDLLVLHNVQPGMCE